jgi:large subunit ribosomal protein L25
MAQSSTTQLTVASRTTGSSRATRRLRRDGQIPGIIYGLGGDPVAFAVDARELRHALAGSGAVLELSIDGSRSEAAVVKEAQRDPVRGDLMHVDLLRVDLNQAIQAIVPVELTGAEDAPGVREGGVLEHITREVNVEALPNDIPDALTLDVSGLDVGGNATVADIPAPQGVRILDDPEAVVATVTAPRLEQELDEIETEVGVVGEAAAAAGGKEAGEASEGAGEPAGE